MSKGKAKQDKPDLLREMFDISIKTARTGQHMSEIAAADVEIATTPKDVVFTEDKVTLYRYRPLREGGPVTGPVLLSYGLIGRWTMIDLQDDRSLVRNLLELGVDLYVVDWGSPTRADRYLTLDDYIDGYLHDCVDFMRKSAGVDAVTLLGICEGGVFTTAFAALHPEKVKGLILTITPIDFHGKPEEFRDNHGFINVWTQSLDHKDVEALVDSFGYLPGEVMGSIFNAMTPVRNLTKYNLDLIEMGNDREKLMNFLRMEKWIADRPHHPGEAAKQWLNDLYKDNKLVKDEMVVNGQKVLLENITMPVLNVFAEQDHIIPMSCTTALKGHVGSKDYTDLKLPGGHVGMFVSSKTQAMFGNEIFNWLKAHV